MHTLGVKCGPSCVCVLTVVVQVKFCGDVEEPSACLSLVQMSMLHDYRNLMTQEMLMTQCMS